MRRINGISFIAILGLAAAYVAWGQSEEHDPVRDAKRHRDCIAENVAKQDGRTKAEIKASCEKAIADGSYHDPNISLDGMIKSPSP